MLLFNKTAHLQDIQALYGLRTSLTWLFVINAGEDLIAALLISPSDGIYLQLDHPDNLLNHCSTIVNLCRYTSM